MTTNFYNTLAISKHRQCRMVRDINSKVYQNIKGCTCK